MPEFDRNSHSEAFVLSFWSTEERLQIGLNKVYIG